MTLPLTGSPPQGGWHGPRLVRRAIAVVNFSPVLKIGDPSGVAIAPFQEEIRSTYPLAQFESEQLFQIEIGPEGMVPQKIDLPIWRFFDREKHWRITLGRDRLALEADDSGYSNWSDFASRFQVLVQAVAKYFAPAQVLRSGVRYVNGRAINGAKDPRHFCNAQLVGISREPNLLQSDLAWRFAVDEGTLLIRTGVLRPNTTYDPVVHDPNEDPFWYLDLDVFQESPRDFDKDAVCSALLAKVIRVHGVYRWAVNAEEES